MHFSLATKTIPQRSYREIKKASLNYFQANQMKSFVKKQKLSIKNKKDLIEIFTYYNSLI